MDVKCNNVLWFQEEKTDDGLIPFSTKPCGKEATVFYRRSRYEARCSECADKEKKRGLPHVFRFISKDEYVIGTTHSE